MRIRRMTVGAAVLAMMMPFGLCGTANAVGEESDTVPVGVVESGSCPEGVESSVDARAACRYLGTTRSYEALEIPFTDGKYLLRSKALDRCVEASEGELYLVFCDYRASRQQWTRESVFPDGTIYRSYVEPDLCVGVANSATFLTADTAITLAD